MKSGLGPCKAQLRPHVIQLSESRPKNGPAAHKRLIPPMLLRYLTPAPQTHVASHFSKAGFGFEMPSLFLLKTIFTTENGFLMSFVPEFICYKVKYFRQHRD